MQALPCTYHYQVPRKTCVCWRARQQPVSIHRHVPYSKKRMGLTPSALHNSEDEVRTADMSTRTQTKESWERLAYLRRKLDVAIAEENYSLAASCRDEVKTLLAALPAVHQYLYRQVSNLRDSKVQLADRLKALKAIVEVGDDIAVPDVAACLGDHEMSGIAYETMWSLFLKHPDPQVGELMIKGIGLMSSPATYDDALAVFNQMIKIAPDFAEGYNKRATVLYTMQRFEDSIADCKRVLELQPYHFGAASGMGLCYLQMNRISEAIEAFESALAIHPRMAGIATVVKELKTRPVQRRGADSSGSGDSAAP